jgi:hypothetical protein
VAGISGLSALDSAERLVWACSCGQGGTVTRCGPNPARAVLEIEAGRHLRERGKEGHGISVGVYATSVCLDPEPKPLVWEATGS